MLSPLRLTFRESPLDSDFCFSLKNGTSAHGSSRIGLRSTNEDRVSALDISGETFQSLYGVMDGHDGDFFAEECTAKLLPSLARSLENTSVEQAKRVITEAFIEFERKNLGLRGGTCILLAVESRTEILLASSGDCICLVVFRDGTWKLPIEPHTPTMELEKQRIENAKLQVFGGRVWDSFLRVGLSTSRSLGDFDLKGLSNNEHSDAVTCVPEFAIIEKGANVHTLLLMTDGVTIPYTKLCAMIVSGNTASDIVDFMVTEDNCTSLTLSLSS